MKRLTCLSVLSLSLGMTLPGAAASLPIAAVGSTPDDVFQAAFSAGAPANGLVGHNRSGWVGPWLQRSAMIPIQGAAIRGDAAAVARNWPVLDATFAHERPDGSFEYAAESNGVATDPNDGAKIDTSTSNAFWLAESAEALLAVRASSLAPQYSARIDALVPRFRSAIEWLARPESVAAMEHYDGIATNRLFEDAKALILGSQLAPSPAAQAAGQTLLADALAQQSPDGYFPEHGGADTSYNAVSCLKLGELSLFVDDSRDRPALERCAAWELSRIESSGHVSEAGNTRSGMSHQTIEGRPYSVNYPEVIRMFVVAGAVLGDPKYSSAAQRITAYHASAPAGS